MQTGVGLPSGQGSDPQVWLSLSNDGGQTWGNEKIGYLGAIGAYRKRVRFLRLGQGRERVMRLQLSDPIGTALIAANIEYQPGSN